MCFAGGAGFAIAKVEARRSEVIEKIMTKNEGSVISEQVWTSVVDEREPRETLMTLEI